MTEYEVFGYLSDRSRPTYDEEVISNATVGDLDNRLLDEYLARLRRHDLEQGSSAYGHLRPVLRMMGGYARRGESRERH
jgi:hypothetical protein